MSSTAAKDDSTSPTSADKSPPSSWRIFLLVGLVAAAVVGGFQWYTSTTTSSSSRVLLESIDGPKTVTVYDNGQSSGGVQVTLFPSHVPSGHALAAYLSEFIVVDGIQLATLPPTPVVADRVYTGHGMLVSSFDDVVHGDRLYLVAPGLLFVWPFVTLGHRVHDSPRVFHVHNFFTDAEADALVDRILTIDDDLDKLQQSHVGHVSGAKKVSRHRTSENAFDQVSDAAVSIRKRSFDLLRVHPYQDDMSDGLQLLRYTQKQAYIAHTDYFSTHTSSDWNWNPKAGGSNRFATVFLYLSNVTAGGQTVFPLADMPPGHDHPPMSPDVQELAQSLFEDNSWEKDMVTKCSTKLASYPRKTHAVLFYSQKPNGYQVPYEIDRELDPQSLHGGCPVLEGTKWAANLWVWNKRRYGLDQARTDKLSVRFVNPSSVAVDLAWKESKMATIPAGHSVPYSSFHGHVWSFRQAGTDTVLHTHTLSVDDGLDQTISLPTTTSGALGDEL
ncbi:hypothetical protein AaE_010200 [Aphanomyces astaci]|uniref:Fe2OG dioxygenase domain-containing protein n=1 Tax=Aphanomyces astaci TaxID=112090 RepID=A0A6A5AA76_APHAT|nr:hypothetical protein AaE_010200 [Aphanomyces astaci]